MKIRKNRLIKWLCVIISIVLISYGAYRLYHYLLAHAIKKITKQVRKEVKESMNPLRWPGKIFDKCKK